MDKWAACCPLIHSRNSVLYQFLEVAREITENYLHNHIKFEMVEDERDRLIELKSNRVGFAVAGLGFVAALVSLVLDYSPAVMLNIIFLSSSFGSICEGFVQLFYYRRGGLNA